MIERERNRPMSGAELIATERQRQIDKEGWSASHDDEHEQGELMLAAVCYAASVGIQPIYVKSCDEWDCVSFTDPWPWDDEWDKRGQHNKVRSLVIAGALLAAEIDRLQRIT
jgi:hypothetical protein